MTFDARNMLAQVVTLIHGLGRGVKKFKLDSEGMLVEGVNGRSVYFVPNGSVLDTLEWKAYENDGKEIKGKAGSVRMMAGWQGSVKKMLMEVFSGKEARIKAIAAKMVETRAEEMAFELMRKGCTMSEAVIVATTICDR